MIVWRSNFKFDEDKIDQIILETTKNYPVISEEDVGLSSSFFEPDLFKRPEAIFLDTYSEKIASAMKDLGLHHRSHYSFDHWLQVYSSDIATHKVHDHYSSMVILSWVHFIRPTEDKCFYFYDSEANKTYPKQDKGDFIIFPSWALHAVSGKKGRSVIAGNIVLNELYSRENRHEDLCHMNEMIDDETIVSKRKMVNSIVDWKAFLG